MENLNKSGLEPRGRAVLIRAFKTKKAGGMIEIPDVVDQSTAMVETRAEVIACGPEAWKDESEPRALPGDKVMVTKFAGFLAKGPADGQIYRLVNDRDIFCRITADAGVTALAEENVLSRIPVEVMMGGANV